MKTVLSEAATGGVLYKKVLLKFEKFTGKYKCQSLFFNKFAGAATFLLIILTWKSLNIVYRKLIKFLRLYLKKILRAHVKDKSCNRSSRLRCFMKKGVIRRPATLLKKRQKFLRTPFLQNISERLLRLQQSWRPATLLKREFNTVVFLWIFQNFL